MIPTTLMMAHVARDHRQPYSSASQTPITVGAVELNAIAVPYAAVRRPIRWGAYSFTRPGKMTFPTPAANIKTMVATNKDRYVGEIPRQTWATAPKSPTAMTAPSKPTFLANHGESAAASA
jgi:uncharacterized membrane protein